MSRSILRLIQVAIYLAHLSCLVQSVALTGNLTPIGLYNKRSCVVPHAILLTNQTSFIAKASTTCTTTADAGGNYLKLLGAKTEGTTFVTTAYDKGKKVVYDGYLNAIPYTDTLCQSPPNPTKGHLVPFKLGNCTHIPNIGHFKISTSPHDYSGYLFTLYGIKIRCTGDPIVYSVLDFNTQRCFNSMLVYAVKTGTGNSLAKINSNQGYKVVLGWWCIVLFLILI
ncbi:hypothetical protein BCR33DRAFT_714591 [Rhizoclosmatium globosum]|uniref:Mannose 6-phosphate receptor domain-containing protein n=1 Tax=Rhizoclosmatium globosum TaxID=329046 RepID=A0A1Y2CMD5_9FUNG|nr:hypothetical protein BCR33DRAFT_714591 [Rhizoclosmatium globosum]|eukprot:ORY48179.1 hypothetical protein BCR33DRAFT_714591 [Rhizoclosmatium globosum]